jgi:hypothetical protein
MSFPKNTVWAIGVLLGVGAIGFAAFMANEGAAQKMETQRLADVELKAKAQEEAERDASAEKVRQERERVEGEKKELRDRCGIAQGLNIVMAYKMGVGNQRVQAVDSNQENIPKSSDELLNMAQGDCRQAIFFVNSGATELAADFQSAPDGAQKAFIERGYNKVAFVDLTTYCHASLMPYPMGLGEIKCRDR